jgi:hypothetical protein
VNIINFYFQQENCAVYSDTLHVNVMCSFLLQNLLVPHISTFLPLQANTRKSITISAFVFLLVVYHLNILFQVWSMHHTSPASGEFDGHNLCCIVSTIHNFLLADLKDNAFAFARPSPLHTLKYLSEIQEMLKTALKIPRNEHRLLSGFLDSNWKND